MTLQTCPHCQAKVRVDRLQKHLRRVHADSRLMRDSSRRNGHQVKARPSERRQASKGKSGLCMVKCSFCGLEQNSPRKRLECNRCGQTDTNPVPVWEAQRQRKSSRKPLLTSRQPQESRASQSMAPHAAKSVPVPGSKGKRRKGEAVQSYGYGTITAAEPWVDNVGPDDWRVHGG